MWHVFDTAGVGLALLARGPAGRCTASDGPAPRRCGCAAVAMGGCAGAHGKEEEDRGLMLSLQLYLSPPRAERVWVARLWASQRLAGRGGGARLAQGRIAHANFS